MLRTIFWMLPSRFMDLRMRASADYDTRVVERPGRWTDAAALDALVGELRSFVDLIVEGSRAETSEGLADGAA